MKDYSRYIKTSYSDELKLLVHLSQNEINSSEILVLINRINWELLLNLATKHRLISHIYKNSQLIEQFVPRAIFEKIRQIKLDQSERSLQYAIFLIRIHQQFKEKNIPHCFFKGLLLSQDLYDDIGFRNFSDIDLIVGLNYLEEAKRVIESLNFECTNPSVKLSNLQQKVNYSLSHHYFFKNEKQNINVELHWNISNPKSFFNINTDEIISTSELVTIGSYKIPYISRTITLVFLAAHGSVHQWYRLFWIKDFSVLLTKTSINDVQKAVDLAKKLGLQNSFYQACHLANLVYKIEMPDFILKKKVKKSLIEIPLRSILINELKFRGITGKLRFVFYRLELKKSIVYYFDLLYRLRTHPNDWRLIRLPDKLFPLYYVLRPFLMIYSSFRKNTSN